MPRRRLALLALLGSAGAAGVSRGKLVGLLWPDRAERAARHLLADAVYRVRKASGAAAITTDGDRLCLNPAIVSVDVQRFAEAISDGDLEFAVELYRGPFLDGFHLPGASAELERWLEAERSRLAAELANAVESLAERAEVGCDPLQAVGWWRRSMAEDPLNSRVALRLMRALAAVGDRANAVQFAREHERVLRDELGVEPPDELSALAETLREPPGPGGLPPPAPSRPVAPQPPFHTRPARPSAERMPFAFVSRETELQGLWTALRSALAGRGRVGLVTGESGTGKTVLVEEFCRRAMAARANLVVASGAGNAHTGPGDPYLPFRDILGLLCGDVESRWAAGSLSHAHATRLWSLLPTTARALSAVGRDLIGTLVAGEELLDRLAAYGRDAGSYRAAIQELLAARRALPEAPTQAALFDQYARVMHAVARERPLVLVLDDLQWADAGSIDLLFQMGRVLHGHRILILGLYRPSEVALGRNGERHPLELVVNELVRAYGELEVPLAEGEDRDFVDRIVDALPGPIDPEFKETLFRHTRGHALFTVELLRGMQDRGMLAPGPEGHRAARAGVDWGALPPRVEAVIAERVGRLPRALERALMVASVEGERFTLEAVAEVLASTVDELLPLVADELERRHHLVRAHGLERVGGQTLSRFRFRHFLFQKYLYDRLDPVERAHFHGRMGRALEGLYGDRAIEVAPSLARHFQEAGMVDEAVAYLHEAGERAKGAAAFPEAVVHFRRAVELLLTLPESPERDRIELREQMALGSIWYGVEGHGFPEARRAFERAKELSEGSDAAAQRFWILYGFGLMEHFQARHDCASALMEEGLAIARSECDQGLAAVAHSALASNALNRGRPREALAHLERFRELYDPPRHLPLLFGWVGDPLAWLEARSGLALWSLGRPDSALARAEAGMRRAREGGHAVSLWAVLLDTVLLRLWRREPEALARHNEALRELSIERSMLEMVPLTTFCRGWRLAADGDLESGASLMERALTELDAQQWAVWRPFWSALLADVYRRTGRAAEGLEMVDRGLEMILHTGERIHEPEQRRIRGQLLRMLRSPDPDEAESELRRAVEVARAQEARSYELRAATTLARLLRETDRADEALRTLSDIHGWFDEGFETADLRDARALLDELEGAGDVAPARVRSAAGPPSHA